jgi:hypothetical protein
MNDAFTISDLRRERGWTLAEMAPRCLVPTKGRMSDIENGKANCTPEQALAIEGLSIADGAPRIDAAALNATVAMVRAGGIHAASHTAPAAPAAPGKSGGITDSESLSLRGGTPPPAANAGAVGSGHPAFAAPAPLSGCGE